jgi:acyl dehydratase
MSEATSPSTTVISTIADIKALLGEEVGVSTWVTIDQETIDAFAQATRHHQGIRGEVERATHESRFGSTKSSIAHGFLILALAQRLTRDVFEIDENDAPNGIKFGVNYGLDKVRFISPLPADSCLRARVEMLALDEQTNSAKFTLRLTFEREGSDRPVAVADWIQRVFTIGAPPVRVGAQAREISTRHERIIATMPERIATLIADFDRVWPTEIAPAPRLRDDGLYDAGVMLWQEVDRPGAARAFRVVKPDEMPAEHWFELEPAEGGTVVRLTVQGHVAGKYEAIWSERIQPLHDRILEALFDNIEAAVASGE